MGKYSFKTFCKRMIYSFFLFLTVNIGVDAQEPFGVNLAGAEFGSAMPGKYNTDYTYPTNAELDYFNSKGLKLIRLPFRWERVQDTLGGKLVVAELNRLKTFIAAATSRNMYVLLDVHNYARYTIADTEYVIGSPKVSVAHFKDLWTKLAFEFKDESHVWGYGLMNEPHDLTSSASWFSVAQEAINGIRTQDSNTRIIVDGTSWSSATTWKFFNNDLYKLVDPKNKLVFDAHCYFDIFGSGEYAMSYTAQGAYPAIGVDRVSPFVEWLKEHKVKGIIGEYGVPANDTNWLPVLNNFQNYLTTNCVNGTYWAAGPWWGGAYQLSVEPIAGVDRPQMAVLQKYLSTGGDCKLSVDEINQTNSIVVYPNPSTDGIFNIKGLEEKDRIKVINNQGILLFDHLAGGGGEKIKIANAIKGIYILFVLKSEGIYKIEKINIE